MTRRRLSGRRSPGVVLALAAATVLTLGGCAGGVDHGTVVDKVHEAESVETVTWCQLVGKITVCSPRQVEHPECWRLTLADGKKQGSVCVSQRLWTDTRLGDTYTPSK